MRIKVRRNIISNPELKYKLMEIKLDKSNFEFKELDNLVKEYFGYFKRDKWDLHPWFSNYILLMNNVVSVRIYTADKKLYKKIKEEIK